MRLLSFHLPKMSGRFLDYAWRNNLSIFARIELEFSTLLLTKCSLTVVTSLSKKGLKLIRFFSILNSSLVLIFVSDFLKRATIPKNHLSLQCVYLNQIAFLNFLLSRTFFTLELAFLCKKNIFGDFAQSIVAGICRNAVHVPDNSGTLPVCKNFLDFVKLIKLLDLDWL